MRIKVRSLALTTILLLSLFNSPGAVAAKTLTFSESSNGHKVQVKSGSVLKITLNSTYWSADRVSNLTKIGDPVMTPIMPGPNAPANCQHPGTGCGTVVWSFKASKKGAASFSASRTSCGEALKCAPDQMLYKLNFLVK